MAADYHHDKKLVADVLASNDAGLDEFVDVAEKVHFDSHEDPENFTELVNHFHFTEVFVSTEAISDKLVRGVKVIAAATLLDIDTHFNFGGYFCN